MPTISGWLKPKSLPRQMIARGPLLVLSQHFIPQYRASARCMAPGTCILCARALPLQVVAVVPVSDPQSETIHLLRLLPTQAHQIQGLQTLGANLQGAILDITLDSKSLTTIRMSGRTVTTYAPIENYVRAIGVKLYNRLMAMELADLNSLLEQTA